MRQLLSAAGRQVKTLKVVGAALVLAGCATVHPRDDVAVGNKAALRQPPAVLRLARAARSNGDFASAINLYRSLIASNPADHKSYAGSYELAPGLREPYPLPEQT